MREATTMAILLLVLAGTGLAQISLPVPGRTQKINLAPTSLGQEYDLVARAVKGTRGSVDFLRVQVQANLPDDTLIRVLVDINICTGQTNIPLGQITLLDGSGELQLTSAPPFCGKMAFDLSEIQTVRLTDAYCEVLAEGSF